MVPQPSTPVDGALREIDATIERVLSRGPYLQARHTAQSRRNVYETALREVYRIAGREAVAELARLIVADVERDGRPPSARDVRQQGAAICRRYGHPVSTGSWLGA